MINNELSVLQNNNIWECDLSLKEIREIYAPKASENEFKAFVGLGRATGLNPFLREIWIIKFGDNPASIFIARDGYRKSAQANSNYDYHHVEAVYSNDEFQYDLKLGEVTHKQNFKDKGILVGAYCLTQKRNASKPTYVFVEFKEYNTGKINWATKPASMIKKVAEAQCLRMAFQELFAGSYAPEETERDREIDITAQSHAEKVQENHRTFEGKPLSQSFTMDADLLDKHLESINSAVDMDFLKAARTAALTDSKGDAKATNDISLAALAKKSELYKAAQDKATLDKQQSSKEWLGEYGAGQEK